MIGLALSDRILVKRFCLAVALSRWLGGFGSKISVYIYIEEQPNPNPSRSFDQTNGDKPT